MHRKYGELRFLINYENDIHTKLARAIQTFQIARKGDRKIVRKR